MTTSHIISTTDPINGVDITNLKDSPHLVEGDNTSDLTIYFDSKASLQTYVDMPVEHPEQELSKSLDNPTDDYAG